MQSKITDTEVLGPERYCSESFSLLSCQTRQSGELRLIESELMHKCAQSVHSEKFWNPRIRTIFRHFYSLFLFEDLRITIDAIPSNFFMHLCESLSCYVFRTSDDTHLPIIELWELCLMIECDTYIYYIFLRIELRRRPITSIRSSILKESTRFYSSR